jgi:hypothetical protein
MSLASIGRQLIQLGRIPVKLHFWFHPTRPRILIRRELVRSALEGREIASGTACRPQCRLKIRRSHLQPKAARSWKAVVRSRLDRHLLLARFDRSLTRSSRPEWEAEPTCRLRRGTNVIDPIRTSRQGQGQRAKPHNVASTSSISKKPDDLGERGAILPEE